MFGPLTYKIILKHIYTDRTSTFYFRKMFRFVMVDTNIPFRNRPH